MSQALCSVIALGTERTSTFTSTARVHRPLAASSAYAPPRPQIANKFHANSRKQWRLTIRADAQDPKSIVTDVIKAGNSALDIVTGFVPDSVPRPVAKIGVGLLSGVVVLSILQTIFNTFFTFLFLGGAIYFGVTYLSKSKETKATSEDPLEEARRIMNKYK